MNNSLKVLTIRLSLETWKRLRDLQTEGKINSIQQAVIDGLAIITEKHTETT